jgi:photosystem II stability/assembly factor-like uncharacterized protein
MKDFLFKLSRHHAFLFLVAGAVLALGLWLARPKPAPPAPAPKGGRVSVLPGPGFWTPVTDVRLPDSQALAFAPDRGTGFLLASDGTRVVTSDGGGDWTADPASPVTEENFDRTTTGGFTPDGRPFLATGLDESVATSIYERRADGWKTTFAGDYGGLVGASADGSVLVGGAGLVVLREGDGWTPRRIEQAERLTLYAAARDGARIVVVGEYGVLLESRDAGRTWARRQIGTAPLYAVALVGDVLLVGGADGSFHRDAGDGFGPVTGLDRGVTVTALASDGRLAVAGGQLAGGGAVVFSSSDAGVTWHLESSAASGRIVAVAFGARGPFAAALTGELLFRQTLTY